MSRAGARDRRRSVCTACHSTSFECVHEDLEALVGVGGVVGDGAAYAEQARDARLQLTRMTTRAWADGPVADPRPAMARGVGLAAGWGCWSRVWDCTASALRTSMGCRPRGRLGVLEGLAGWQGSDVARLSAEHPLGGALQGRPRDLGGRRPRGRHGVQRPHRGGGRRGRSGADARLGGCGGLLGGRVGGRRADPTRSPGLEELCDGFDRDCDELSDFGDPDLDRYGDGSNPDGDCDDDSRRSPGRAARSRRRAISSDFFERACSGDSFRPPTSRSTPTSPRENSAFCWPRSSGRPHRTGRW